HTRSLRDWSSDVCSSDLSIEFPCLQSDDIKLNKDERRCYQRIDMLMRGSEGRAKYKVTLPTLWRQTTKGVAALVADGLASIIPRSEERRVGSECRSGWAT